MNSSAEPKRCTRCVLPANFRNLRFDRHGVCNYCRNHDRYIGRFRRYDLAREMFLKQVEANRGKYRYDCAVGISGGKDSCYVLHQLVKNYGLKVLAFTTDNGWLEPRALEIARRVTGELGVDHVVLQFDPAHYRLYQAATTKLGWPCVACSFLGIARVQRYCFDQKIPLCVHGRSRSQMLRELSRFSHDSYLPYYGMIYRPYDFSAVLKSVRAVRAQLDRLLGVLIPDEPERRAYVSKYVIDPGACEREQFAPQFIAYFLMEEYDRDRVIDFMESRVLSRQRMPKVDHSDCCASDFFMHVYKQAFGWSLLELEIAFDVRDGKLTREEALARIREEKSAFEFPRESADRVCAKLGTTPQQLLALDTARGNIAKYRRLKRLKNLITPAFPPAA